MTRLVVAARRRHRHGIRGDDGRIFTLRLVAPQPDSWKGEFALYDEYDPRRVVRLNADGTKVTPGTGGLERVLNLVSNEGVIRVDAM